MMSETLDCSKITVKCFVLVIISGKGGEGRDIGEREGRDRGERERVRKWRKAQFDRDKTSDMNRRQGHNCCFHC